MHEHPEKYLVRGSRCWPSFHAEHPYDLITIVSDPEFVKTPPKCPQPLCVYEADPTTGQNMADGSVDRYELEVRKIPDESLERDRAVVSLEWFRSPPCCLHSRRRLRSGIGSGLDGADGGADAYLVVSLDQQLHDRSRHR